MAQQYMKLENAKFKLGHSYSATQIGKKSTIIRMTVNVDSFKFHKVLNFGA